MELSIGYRLEDFTSFETFINTLSFDRYEAGVRSPTPVEGDLG